MADDSVPLLLMSASLLASALDVDIMHTRSPVKFSNDSGIIGGTPRNDPRMDDSLNWPRPYSWYRERASEDVST